MELFEQYIRSLKTDPFPRQAAKLSGTEQLYQGR